MHNRDQFGRSYCPTCTALHDTRAKDFRLRQVEGSPHVWHCGYCGRDWRRTREGFTRANVAQGEMAL